MHFFIVIFFFLENGPYGLIGIPIQENQTLLSKSLFLTGLPLLDFFYLFILSPSPTDQQLPLF